MSTNKKVLRFKSDPIFLRSFGSAIAMNFQNNSGSVEIIMTFPEINRILTALREYETTKPEPSAEVTTAIDKLKERFLLRVTLKWFWMFLSQRIEFFFDQQ